MVRSEVRLESVHCSKYDRSWIDLVTNLSLLSGVDLTKQFGNFFQYGKFPQSCLPSFLHELVHHWCFQSAVGSTLALLYLRARRRALMISGPEEKSSPISDFDVVEDLGRYELVVNLLRPLAEGLALFAEFDVVPQHTSRFMTVPLQWVYLSFTTPSKEELRDHFGFSLFKLIWDMRNSPLYRKRKSSALLEPLDCGHGGYLAGYLTVKGMWLDAVRRCSLFSDKELFLAYLRCFIYDDFGLVAHLLNPSTSEIGAINEISNYVQNRFNQYLDADIAADGERFANEVSSLAIGVNRERNFTLSTNTDLANIGKRRMEELLNQAKTPTDSAFEETIRHIDRWTMAQRDIMCIGSATAQLHVPVPGRIIVQAANGPILAGPHLPDATVSDGECCVEFYISPCGFFKAGVVSQKQVIILSHIISIGKLDERMDWQFKNYRVDRDQNQNLNEMFAEFLETFIKNKPSFVVLKHVREYIAEAPTAIYMNLLAPVLNGLQEAFAKDMKSTGFSSLLNNDANTVQAIACLSLCCSLTEDKSAIADMMRNAGHDLETTLENAEQIRKDRGIRLAVAVENEVWSLI
jgi:hypothetical protein